MTTASEVRARVLDAVAGVDVAIAAGVAAATWADTTAPHVFEGDQIAGGGRNRGRLPFVEVFIETSQPFTPEGTEIGMVETRVRLRAHVGGASRTTARGTAEAILGACFAAIRADTYFAQGDQSIEAFDSQPLWHRLEGALRAQHTYDPATFEGT